MTCDHNPNIICERCRPTNWGIIETIEREAWQRGVTWAQEQPRPLPNALPAVWSLVQLDMRTRDAIGRERYGTPLQPHNGRDALRDLYEELLDACVYARQALYERDGK